MLSNFWPCLLQIDGQTWASVEHYYQASKFKHDNPEFYARFALDTDNGELATNPALAKAAGGKTGKYQGKQFRPKYIVADKDFFSTDRHRTEMETAQAVKFAIPELADMLALTAGAELIHTLGRGRGTVRFDFVMALRDKALLTSKLQECTLAPLGEEDGWQPQCTRASVKSEFTYCGGRRFAEIEHKTLAQALQGRPSPPIYLDDNL